MLKIGQSPAHGAAPAAHSASEHVSGAYMSRGRLPHHHLAHCDCLSLHHRLPMPKNSFTLQLAQLGNAHLGLSDTLVDSSEHAHYVTQVTCRSCACESLSGSLALVDVMRALLHRHMTYAVTWDAVVCVCLGNDELKWKGFAGSYRRG